MRNRQRNRFNITASILILALALGLAAGCARTGSNVNTQNYSDDGYLGMTNSHPKIPGRHMALNYKSDADMMKQSIRNLPGVAGMNVTFNGADAYVTVKLDQGLTAKEIPSVERQAASVLRFNFPRYNIHVSSMPSGNRTR